MALILTHELVLSYIFFWHSLEPLTVSYWVIQATLTLSLLASYMVSPVSYLPRRIRDSMTVRVQRLDWTGINSGALRWCGLEDKSKIHLSSMRNLFNTPSHDFHSKSVLGCHKPLLTLLPTTPHYESNMCAMRRRIAVRFSVGSHRLRITPSFDIYVSLVDMYHFQSKFFAVTNRCLLHNHITLLSEM
jgi:hypothetical protein